MNLAKYAINKNMTLEEYETLKSNIEKRQWQLNKITVPCIKQTLACITI